MEQEEKKKHQGISLHPSIYVVTEWGLNPTDGMKERIICRIIVTVRRTRGDRSRFKDGLCYIKRK